MGRDSFEPKEGAILLGLLEAVAEDGGRTQRSLAAELDIAVGLVNAYLKRCVKKGLVKVSEAPARRYAYYLTPKGFSEKSRLVAQYLEGSLDFFRKARREYTGIFAKAKGAGRQEIVFVGDGELVEIAGLAAREVGVEVIGVFDPDVKTGRSYGLPILRRLDNVPLSAVLIVTGSRHPQSAYDKAQALPGGRPVLAPKFLRVVQAEVAMPHAAVNAGE